MNKIKAQIYWRIMSPILLVPVAIVAVPLLILYMWIRHPRDSLAAWRQTRDY